MATQLPFPTINVVPAGFRWSAEAAQKAAQKGAFLRVGGPQVTRRYLSGVKRSWTSAKPEENQTIFHTGYRITGTPDAIRTALLYAGVAQNEVENVLATAITRDNYATTKRQEVEAELAAHNQAKQAKPIAEGYEWAQILWFGQNIKTAVISTKTGEQKGPVASPGRGGAGDTLADKIKKLGQGKVLDVSNMDINTGKGVRSVPAPKTAKSGKYGTGRVPIISNDVNKYIRAIQLAYGAEGEQAYAQDIGVVRQALSNIGGPAIAGQQAGQGMNMAFGQQGQQGRTEAPRVPSPLQPGATLAQPPQFAAATVVPTVTTPRGAVGNVGGNQFPAIPPLGNLLGGQGGR